MKDRLPTLIAIALLAGLVVITWWAVGHTQRSLAVDPPPRLTHEPDSWATGFIMMRTDLQGMPTNRLSGSGMRHYPDDDSYEVTDAVAIDQQPDAPVLYGSARTAILHAGGDRVELHGDARVRRLPDADRPELTVTSEHLTLLPNEDTVKTDEPAVVVNGQSVMHGKGMRYDNRTRQLQVFAAADVKISGQDARRPGPPTSSSRPDDSP